MMIVGNDIIAIMKLMMMIMVVIITTMNLVLLSFGDPEFLSTHFAKTRSPN